jgi:hypothetical protein
MINIPRATADSVRMMAIAVIDAPMGTRQVLVRHSCLRMRQVQWVTSGEIIGGVLGPHKMASLSWLWAALPSACRGGARHGGRS